MANQSYQGRKYDAGRLVVPASGEQRVGVVEPRSKYELGNPGTVGNGYGMHYWVQYAYGRGAFHSLAYWGEDSLREPTWWQFLFHRNPESGERQIGNNPLWAFIVGLVITIPVSFGGFYWGASSKLWEWVCVLPLVLLLAWYAIGTNANFRRKPR